MTVINDEGRSADRVSKNIPLEAQTMVLTASKEKSLRPGPRLVCTNSTGESKVYPLDKEKLVIGRSVEADLNLLDPLVSRKHCVVEKRNDCFVVRNVSTTNPLFLNDHSIAEKRLYSGDQIKIGSASLAFISDRPEDARRLDTQMLKKHKRSGRSFWIAVCLLLVLAGYFAYSNAYTPWKVKWELQSVAKLMNAGNSAQAQNKLKRLLDLNLPPDYAHQINELLAESALAVTQEKAQTESMDAAMEYLVSYLADYGAAKEAEVLWGRLDYFRLSLGQRLESAKDYQQALRHYAAIKEDSIYFEEAHKAIRRIWLAHQQQSREDQTVVQLLKEADAHFQAKQYLKPVNQNAYVLYQAVLALEPEHELALARIEEMKVFYRENGEKYLTKKNWSRALSYFERYYLMDTDTEEINASIKICREKMAETRTVSQKSTQSPKASKRKLLGKSTKARSGEQDEKREEIRRMLEESGTESNWIMKYLFEDPNGEKDPDKPW